MSSNVGDRKGLFGFMSAILGVVIAVVILEVGLGLLKPRIDPAGQMDEGFILYDSRLGWKLAPGWQGRHVHHDFDVTYRVNPLGFRGNELDFARPGSVMFLGDSFTFGLGANDEEVFTELLDQSSGQTYLNAGVPGYSNDQQLVLLDSLLEYRPKELVWVVYLGNDLLDNGAPFPLQAAHGKPFYRLAPNGSLSLENVPVPLKPKPPAFNGKSVRSEILQGYQPYNVFQDWIANFEVGRIVNQWVGIDAKALREHLLVSTQEQVDLFMGFIAQGNASLEEAGIQLQVALLPGQGLTREGSIPQVYQKVLSSVLTQRLEEEGVDVLDFVSKLEIEESPESLFHPNEGHFNRAGHRWLADVFSESLSD
ncbi:hypothetical protein [Marinobacter sp. CHS3-4]|uniref:SGNH/GDSL hydrolase family protein n=1 Tax=Marinobacter sp. CHS3-4 TaxID=3045174 RepID=UPI0024B5C97E|nr:hypothetical protein [Marinobacter sp. CHS3-4]MDI9245563.1 hypothetical protein [Marinobacter sp. CHS3-4]